MGKRSRRTAQHRHARRVHVGDNIVAEHLGQTFEFTKGKELPPKRPGEHRWMAFGAWRLTLDDAARAYETTPKLLDHENLVDLGIACWDCELPLSPDTPADGRCAAPADGP